jgi:hypothetical protein
MATPRYGGRGYRQSRFGPSLIEASLALSVIVGFLFVTMRIMNMPDLVAQTAAAQPGVTQTDTVVVRTDPPAPGTLETKNP